MKSCKIISDTTNDFSVVKVLLSITSSTVVILDPIEIVNTSILTYEIIITNNTDKKLYINLIDSFFGLKLNKDDSKSEISNAYTLVSSSCTTVKPNNFTKIAEHQGELVDSCDSYVGPNSRCKIRFRVGIKDKRVSINGEIGKYSPLLVNDWCGVLTFVGQFAKLDKHCTIKEKPFTVVISPVKCDASSTINDLQGAKRSSQKTAA